MSLRVSPFDISTYLVSSRTRDEIEHLVDLSDAETPECSCEATLDFKHYTPQDPCPHVIAAIAFRNGRKITRRKGGSPVAMFGRMVKDF